MARKFLIAEYCAGPFYMGWWLYLRDRNDGSPNDDGWDAWGWMRCSCSDSCNCELCRVYDLCVGLGKTPPVPQRYRQQLAEWFAGEFPAGLLVDVDEYRRLTLVEIVAEMPKQVHRRIIRTVKRAEASFKRACRAATK